jgi:ADP-ribose pyrophosphatase
MDHQILEKKTVYSGSAFKVERLHIRLPNERERDYDLVRHLDSVTLLPLDKENQIWFVTQFRMGSEKKLLELPAGVMAEGESPQECALREIREETGMAAGKIEHLGAVYLAPGYSSELNHIFLATDLFPSPLDMDEDEFLEIEKISLAEIPALIQSGRLQDSKSLAAFQLAASRMKI